MLRLFYFSTQQVSCYLREAIEILLRIQLIVENVTLHSCLFNEPKILHIFRCAIFLHIVIGHHKYRGTCAKYFLFCHFFFEFSPSPLNSCTYFVEDQSFCSNNGYFFENKQLSTREWYLVIERKQEVLLVVFFSIVSSTRVVMKYANKKYPKL